VLTSNDWLNQTEDYKSDWDPARLPVFRFFKDSNLQQIEVGMSKTNAREYDGA
jgi:hypothetical protein